MRVAVIGQPGYIKDSSKLNIDNLFRSVGFNTGNLVYMYAVTEHIQSEKKFFGWKVDADLINNEFDVMVFVVVNQLHPQKDMSILAELFESINIPSFIIGLGAQASNFNEDLVFTKGTLRFIDLIKEKCSHISVRGEYTASILTKYGAKNVIATGCPSNFINFDPNLGDKIVTKKNSIKLLVVNNNIRESMDGFLSNIITYYEYNEYKDLKFIMQEPKLVLDFCRNKTTSIYYKQVIQKINNTIMKKYIYEDVETFSINNFEIFFNVESWMEYLLRFDLSLGTRMHGNMIALQSGIPIVFLTHDARLEEMVSIMKLPSISFNDVKNLTKVEEMLDLIKFNPKVYNQNRRLLAKKFYDIYTFHNLNIHKGLDLLAN